MPEIPETKTEEKNSYLVALLAAGVATLFLSFIAPVFGFITFIIVIISTVTVYNDAKAIGVGRGFNKEILGETVTWKPLTWSLLVFFFWIIFLPLYLVKKGGAFKGGLKMESDRIFCNKCGTENETGNFCKKCGASLREVSKPNKPSVAWYLLPLFFSILGGIIGYIVLKVKDEKMAKNILYVGLGTFVLSIILIAAVPSPPPSDTGVPEVPPSSSSPIPVATPSPTPTPILLITKPIKDMLPVRENIPSEFRTGSIMKVTIDASGFIEGSKIQYTKIEGTYGAIILGFVAYRFDTVENARAYYNGKIDKIKNEGGYTELKFDVGVESFTYKVEQGWEYDQTTNLCLKDNVVFATEVMIVNSFKSSKSYLKDNAKMFAERVTK